MPMLHRWSKEETMKEEKGHLKETLDLLMLYGKIIDKFVTTASIPTYVSPKIEIHPNISTQKDIT